MCPLSLEANNWVMFWLLHFGFQKGFHNARSVWVDGYKSGTNQLWAKVCRWEPVPICVHVLKGCLVHHLCWPWAQSHTLVSLNKLVCQSVAMSFQRSWKDDTLLCNKKMSALAYLSVCVDFYSSACPCWMHPVWHLAYTHTHAVL